MNPSEQITRYIKDVGDWRGPMLARLRRLILAAAPVLVEEWKWNTPVWSHNGNVVAAGAFQDHCKINFFKGASLDDPDGLFNAGLDAKATRAIDIREGDILNEAALMQLIRTAVAHNSSGPMSQTGPKQKTTGPKQKTTGPNTRRLGRNRKTTGPKQKPGPGRKAAPAKTHKKRT